MTQDYRIHNLSSYPHSRQTVTEHILNKVNQAFDLIEAQYFDAHSNYSRVARELARKDALASGDTEAQDEAQEEYLFNRERLSEAWMAAHYFNSMLSNLERSQAAADLLTMNVPSPAAPLNEWLLELMESTQDSVQRTYYSRESCRSSCKVAFLIRL